MNEYNFVVLYRKGEANAGPDALSRNPVDSLEAINITNAQIVEMQSKDTFIEQIKQYLTDQWLPTNKKLAQKIITYAQSCIIDDLGILHFVYKKKGMEDKLLLWAPEKIRKDIIDSAHSTRFAGHSGIFRTLAKIQHRFFWPGMSTMVKDIVQACQVCQQCKKPKQSHLQSPLHPIPSPNFPNTRVHADLLGPLRASTGGKKWILVITDAFTKYAVCTGIEDKEATTVAKAIMEKWICTFSVPKTLTTDRGTDFCNKVLDELAVLLGIDRHKTAAFHPASNSAAESYNRTMIKFLTQALINRSTLDWEEMLPMCNISYNTQVHKSTLFTPFYLTFLHSPNLPFFDMEIPSTKYSDSWATEAYLRMQNAFRLAQRNNDEANRKLKEYVDKRTTKRNFEVGDKVIVYYPKHVPQPGKQKGNIKFEPPGRGGFEITARTTEDSYKVKQGPFGRPTNVNVQRLALDRSAIGGQPQYTVLPQPQPTPPLQADIGPITRSRAKKRSSNPIDHLTARVDKKLRTPSTTRIYLELNASQTNYDMNWENLNNDNFDWFNDSDSQSTLSDNVFTADKIANILTTLTTNDGQTSPIQDTDNIHAEKSKMAADVLPEDDQPGPSNIQRPILPSPDTLVLPPDSDSSISDLDIDPPARPGPSAQQARESNINQIKEMQRLTKLFHEGKEKEKTPFNPDVAESAEMAPPPLAKALQKVDAVARELFKRKKRSEPPPAPPSPPRTRHRSGKETKPPDRYGWQ
jgi:transposase InsO family protein